MQKTKRPSKFMALLLVLMMVLSILPMSAMAVEDGYSLTPYDSNVTTLTITGVDVNTHSRTSEPVTTGSTNIRTTYNIVLPATVRDTRTATINFTAPSTNVVSSIPPQGQPGQFIPMINGNASDTYTVTLAAGVATKTVYVHKNFPTDYGSCDIYTFNFSKGDLSNPVGAGNGLNLRFGDPAYPNTEPECYMTFTGSGNDYTVNYSGPYGDSSAASYDYYPDILALYIDNSAAITAMSGTNMTLKVYNAETGDLLESGSELTTQKNAGFYTVELAAGAGLSRVLSITNSSGTVDLTFKQPKAMSLPGGSTPTSVTSYLPIGQYASGLGWGDVTGKFTGGYSSTGVSLGAFGGYIEFDFGQDNGITNGANNPYGVDFVVYGNAFNGNPEAGAVQVSVDGSVWYELAGSKYYDGGFAATGASQSTGKFANGYTGTLRNADVAYTLGSSIAATLTGSGGSLTANPFTNAIAWWPTTGEYADSVIAAAHQDSNVTIARTGSTLTFGGITAIQDSNATLDYAFGYADVTPNGTPATYGDAVNPYTTYTSGKTGGDGFDLEWAVDISTGLPVDVTDMTFRYVRVYSAVLDNATFGETSTEVCGIFTTANQASTSVGTTAAPTSILIEGEEISTDGVTTVGNTVIYDVDGIYEGMPVDVTAASGANVYINSSASNSYTVGAGTDYIRIIVQTGDAAPYIAIIK